MSASHPLQAFLKKYPDTRYLDVFYCDLSCIVRGKRYPIGQAEKIFDSGAMTPGSCFLLAVTGESMDPAGMGFTDGDPDEIGRPIPATLGPAPWTQVPVAQVMLTLESLDGTPFYYEPRNVLRRVLDRFDDLGLRPVVAFELEFYLADAGRDGSGGILPPRSPLTGRRPDTAQVYSMEEVEEFALYLDEVTTTCAMQGITTGAISAEYAPGQFEINLQHRDDPLAAADQCVIFRRTVQGIARKHGLQASFMAKPYPDQAGSGLHLHISLLDDRGTNVLDGGGRYATPACGSRLLFHGIGGLRETMGDSMAIFAPNANSYHRFVPNIFVPVTPCWGYENRSVAMRIPKSPGKARRIEHRVAGADANPYLTLATLLAAIHHGIRNQVDPGEPAAGNAGKAADPDLPLDIERALARCRQSAFLSRYLGADYIRAYTECKLNEYHAFSQSGDSPIQWYF
ncbi:MAG: glutamine synthetase family protein [Gammaproteobacteria bacterium]|nr:glutamine synthetase family protein [Gammaproteobacteria bacterium]